MHAPASLGTERRSGAVFLIFKMVGCLDRHPKDGSPALPDRICRRHTSELRLQTGGRNGKPVGRSGLLRCTFMSGERIISSQVPALAPGEIHIWHIDLAQPEAAVAALRVFLPREELERAARFHFAVHRDRFVVAHAALRSILGSYLNAAPESLKFIAGSHGKPDLEPQSNPLGLTFNLSHSGDRGMVGVALQDQLGVDIEQIRADFAGCEIAERFFSPREVVALRAVPSDLQVDAFFECWTRKEAFIKACGQGLSFGLDNFDVAFGPGEVPALLHVKPDPREASRWKLYNIAPAPEGYKAALVVEGADHVLQQREWVNPLAPA